MAAKQLREPEVAPTLSPPASLPAYTPSQIHPTALPLTPTSDGVTRGAPDAGPVHSQLYTRGGKSDESQRETWSLWLGLTQQTLIVLNNMRISKQSLTWGLPEYRRHIFFPHRTVDETNKYTTCVLLREHGEKQITCDPFFYLQLDSVAASPSQCLRAVAAAEKAVMASRDWLLWFDTSCSACYLNDPSWTENDTLISSEMAALSLFVAWNPLLTPDITIKLCTALNPVTLLPIADKKPQDCVQKSILHTCG